MEFDGYVRFFLALIFVLALIGVLATIGRRFGFGYRRPEAHGRARRLSIVEVMPVDSKRRLLLVRRDSTEHLVLLGANSDVVVEGSIAVDDFAVALAGSAGSPADAEPAKDGTQ